MLGRPVNPSARGVLTGDNSLRYGEVGIPLRIAQELTRLERVTKSNVSQMLDLVQNFPKYPCVVAILRDNREHIVKENHWVIPRMGDTVKRMLLNGDSVLVNRQPTTI